LTTRPASNNRNKLTNKLTIACTLECLIVTYLLRSNSRTKVSLTCFNVCFLCNKARYGRDDNPASNRLWITDSCFYGAAEAFTDDFYNIHSFKLHSIQNLTVWTKQYASYVALRCYTVAIFVTY